MFGANLYEIKSNYSLILGSIKQMDAARWKAVKSRRGKNSCIWKKKKGKVIHMDENHGSPFKPNRTKKFCV